VKSFVLLRLGIGRAIRRRRSCQRALSTCRPDQLPLLARSWILGPEHLASSEGGWIRYRFYSKYFPGEAANVETPAAKVVGCCVADVFGVGLQGRCYQNSHRGKHANKGRPLDESRLGWSCPDDQQRRPRITKTTSPARLLATQDKLSFL
jgi:hypothetical protein